MTSEIIRIDTDSSVFKEISNRFQVLDRAFSECVKNKLGDIAREIFCKHYDLNDAAFSAVNIPVNKEISRRCYINYLRGTLENRDRLFTGFYRKIRGNPEVYSLAENLQILLYARPIIDKLEDRVKRLSDRFSLSDEEEMKLNLWLKKPMILSEESVKDRNLPEDILSDILQSVDDFERYVDILSEDFSDLTGNYNYLLIQAASGGLNAGMQR